MSDEVQNSLSFLVRKGLNDEEIYREIGRVYGKHVIHSYSSYVPDEKM